MSDPACAPLDERLAFSRRVPPVRGLVMVPPTSRLRVQLFCTAGFSPRQCDLRVYAKLAVRRIGPMLLGFGEMAMVGELRRGDPERSTNWPSHSGGGELGRGDPERSTNWPSHSGGREKESWEGRACRHLNHKLRLQAQGVVATDDLWPEASFEVSRLTF